MSIELSRTTIENYTIYEEYNEDHMWYRITLRNEKDDLLWDTGTEDLRRSREIHAAITNGVFIALGELAREAKEKGA